MALHTNFLQQRTLLAPVAVEAIVLIKSSVRIRKAKQQYHAVVHTLIHSVNLTLRASGLNLASKNNVGFGLVISGLGWVCALK